MTFVNLTPHEIVLNDGRKFAPSGAVARVSSSYSEFRSDVAEVVFGAVEGLPPETDGVLFIVSGLVAAAMKGRRGDLVSPATGHPETVRTADRKSIVSVPGFIRA